MTMQRLNELLADGAETTARHIAGRHPTNGLRQVARWRWRFVLATWNYAYGQWNVDDRKSGFGSAISIKDACAGCPNSPQTYTLAQIIDQVSDWPPVAAELAREIQQPCASGPSDVNG